MKTCRTRRSGFFWGAVLGLAIAIVCLAPLPLRGAVEDPAAAFDAANRLYEQGAFAEAAKAYEALLGPGGTSATVLYNLGNAHFKSGRTGRAIAAYRAALALAPREPDVLANLKFARNQVAGPTWRASRGEAWLQKLSLNEWAAGTTALFWVTLGLVVARCLRPGWKPALRVWILSGTILTLGCAALTAIRWHQARTIVTAIVTLPNAPVRLSPFEEAGLSFTAADGAELRVFDRKDDWLQVYADNGRNGWIPAEKVALSAGP
jgi:tetratricopeptide (TPR) repeat protein